MQLFHISQFTIELVTELPLRTTAILGVLRRSFLCIADSVNYSIVDLNEKTLVPLLPISQDPPDDEPADGDAPRTEAKPKSYQKPSIMPVEEDEFLVASHTGHTTLGLFIRENGEPTRGTLEWASNVKSIGGPDACHLGIAPNRLTKEISGRPSALLAFLQLLTSRT